METLSWKSKSKGRRTCCGQQCEPRDPGTWMSLAVGSVGRRNGNPGVRFQVHQCWLRRGSPGRRGELLLGTGPPYRKGITWSPRPCQKYKSIKTPPGTGGLATMTSKGTNCIYKGRHTLCPLAASSSPEAKQHLSSVQGPQLQGQDGMNTVLCLQAGSSRRPLCCVLPRHPSLALPASHPQKPPLPYPS